MYNSSELEQINVTIEEAQKSINQLEALQRLRSNSDFKLLIEEGYLKEEAARLVLVRAEPNLQDKQDQKMINNMIISVGYFRQYLNKVYQFGSHAQHAIEDHRNTRNEIMSETN